MAWVDLERFAAPLKNTNMDKNIVCFGEVLWDVFPEHKIIGGAPLNVALRLKSLGNKVAMISRVGNDELGRGIINYLEKQNLPTEFIQLDSKLGTGEVGVTINEKGSASYEILWPRAWDSISISQKDIDLVKNSDIFIYGSLAGRNETTLQSLLLLLNDASYKVFDVNLRAPYYSPEILKKLMYQADFIKFNDDELFEIGGFLGCDSASLEQNIFFIAECLDCSQICVTKGKHGAILLYDGELHYNSGYHITVVDTVGAGDSFLATLLTYLSTHSPKQALDYACAMGALVAATMGANTEIPIVNVLEMVGQGSRNMRFDY